MGQPIKLLKGNEVMTVYGRAQAAVHAANGWHTDDKEIMATASANEPGLSLIDAVGISPAIGVALNAAGFDTIESLKNATIDELTAVSGIGKKTAERIKLSVEGI